MSYVKQCDIAYCNLTQIRAAIFSEVDLDHLTDILHIRKLLNLYPDLCGEHLKQKLKGIIKKLEKDESNKKDIARIDKFIDTVLKWVD